MIRHAFLKRVNKLFDASAGSDVGEGFTNTGLDYDSDLNALVIGNWGRADAESGSGNSPSLVISPLDISSKTAEYDISGDLTNGVQGVAVDTTNGTYWVADQADVIEFTKLGVATGNSFTLSGANGLAYDPSDDTLLVSVSRTITRREKDGTVLSSHNFDSLLSTDTVDHIAIWDDDYIAISYGNNNNKGAVAILDLSDDSVVYTFRTPEADAIEGLTVVGDDLYINSDGYAHSTTTGENRVVKYTLYTADEDGRAWTLDDIDSDNLDLLHYWDASNVVASSGNLVSVTDGSGGSITGTSVGTVAVEEDAINGLPALNVGDSANAVGVNFGRSGWEALIDNPDTPHFHVLAIDNVEGGTIFSNRNDTETGFQCGCNATTVNYFAGGTNNIPTQSYDENTYVVACYINPETNKLAVRVNGESSIELSPESGTSSANVNLGFRNDTGSSNTDFPLGCPDGTGGARIATGITVVGDWDVEELLRIEGFVADRYGITLDDSHPYVASAPTVPIPNLGATQYTRHLLSPTLARENIIAPRFDINGTVVSPKATYDRTLDVMDVNGVPQYSGSATVTFENVASDLEIRYTTNGKNPTYKSKLYSEPLVIRQNLTGSDNTVIKATIYNKNNSNIKSKTIRIEFRIV
jgi:hypothetical protein